MKATIKNHEWLPPKTDETTIEGGISRDKTFSVTIHRQKPAQMLESSLVIKAGNQVVYPES